MPRRPPPPLLTATVVYRTEDGGVRTAARRINRARGRSPTETGNRFVGLRHRHRPRAQLQELSTVWQGAGHIAGAATAIAFVLPVPPSDRRKVTDQYDVGQATMAVMLAATDRGIGTGHSSVGDQDKARAILGVPNDYQVAYLLGVGYPADRPLKPIRKPNRRPFDEVVHHGHW